MSAQKTDREALGSVPEVLPTPKAIGSLAKKQSDVTRQGTQKLKFVPTLPQRRKKEDLKIESVVTSTSSPPSTEKARGRGRGRGRGDEDTRGRGRGRGVLPVLEMTASGPFALGPANAGSSMRRSTPRSNFVPNMLLASGSRSSLGANLSNSAAPALKKEPDISDKGKAKQISDAAEEEVEVYSDPDDGVEIIDMEHIRDMDWMAPESLKRERQNKKRIKREAPATEEVNTANALDLSESEEEEELEDIIEDFASYINVDVEPPLREDRLYFFQFPTPFPTFVPHIPTSLPVSADVPISDSSNKKVSFVSDVKPTPDSSRTASTAPPDPQSQTIDGKIGQLELYRSGAVKIRLGNGMLLDVNAATQPSFLQQAVHLDKEEKRLTVIGEVNKQFIVSPDIDTLLAAMEEADKKLPVIDGEESMIKMDTT